MPIITYQTERPLQIFTKEAVGAVSNRHFIKASGAQCTVKGERAQGVSREDAANGQSYAYTLEGTALVMAGEGLSADVEVTTNANGHAVKALDGEYINGVTMNAQISGQLVEIRVGGAMVSQNIHATTTTTTTTTTTSA